MLPPGLRIYAIGDIHGRFDLLTALGAKIADDLGSGRPPRAIEIYVGDYIDRGPQSREVVEWLVATPPLTDERVCLLGNHEDMLLDVIAGPEGMLNWIANGGSATLASYGVPPPHLAVSSFEHIRLEFLQNRFPTSHRRFVEALPRVVQYGGYAFAHAGVRPGRGFAEQDPDDLVWIREPFLYSDADFGAVVVHGHTPAAEPEIRPNRINIDTGAFYTGRLTCLVLEGKTRRFLSTARDQD